MSGMLQSADITAEGVAHALQLALARLPDTRTLDVRRAEGMARLEVAGKAIGAEMRRRAFTPRGAADIHG
jgi:hypothetical protein